MQILKVVINGGGNCQSFLWCQLEWQEDGYQVSVPQRQGSGQNRSIRGRMPCWRFQ